MWANLYKYYRQLLSFLIYLPNVTPFKMLFKSEIFPWAFVYSLRRSFTIPLGYSIFLVYMLLSAVYILSKGEPILVPARALFALLNVTFIFFCILKVDDKEFSQLQKAFTWVFGINVVLSLIQYFGLFPSFLTPFMRIFIDRFTDEPHGLGRGVAALFAEPSYASLSIHYYFAYFMLQHRIDQKSLLGYGAILLMILFDLFIIRSITGLVMIFVYYVSLQERKYIVRGAVVLLFVGLLVLYLAKQTDEPPRAVDFLYSVVYDQEYKDPLPFLLNESGFRVISVWAAYVYGFANPLGSGIGGWGPASLIAMDAIGVPATEIGFFASYSGGDFDGVRPTSFIADIFLEMGWVGFVLFVLAFWSYMTNKTLFNNIYARPVLVMFYFNLFVMGTIGDPLPFIFLALAYREFFPPQPKTNLLVT
jgi:hypothetical protein